MLNLFVKFLKLKRLNFYYFSSTLPWCAHMCENINFLKIISRKNIQRNVWREITEWKEIDSRSAKLKLFIDIVEGLHGFVLGYFRKSWSFQKSDCWNVRFCVPNFHSLERKEIIEGIFIRWRHERLSSTRLKILRADEKLRSGDRQSVVGSVKFTAKHLFDCKCAIVRRTLKKPRVVKWRKNASSERKLKITNRKKIQKRFLQFAIKTVQVADSDSSVSGNFLF